MGLLPTLFKRSVSILLENTVHRVDIQRGRLKKYIINTKKKTIVKEKKDTYEILPNGNNIHMIIQIHLKFGGELRIRSYDTLDISKYGIRFVRR